MSPGDGEIPRTGPEKLAPGTGSPAASRWDGDNNEGEFTVLVGGRFAALAEGTHLDRIDTLREFVALVDLKKLTELK